jgi:hypothetical protein
VHLSLSGAPTFTFQCYEDYTSLSWKTEEDLRRVLEESGVERSEMFPETS